MSSGRRAARRLAARAREENGSAVVEFIGVTVMLLIPLVYLVLTLGRVQGAMFAAEAAARESGRNVSHAEELAVASGHARNAVELAFADQGFSVDGGEALLLTCEADPCLSRGARIHVQVGTTVRLPLVPDYLMSRAPLEIPVRAEHLAVVPEFGAVP